MQKRSNACILNSGSDKQNRFVYVTLHHANIMNIFISPKLVVQYIHDKARTKLT